MGGGIAYRGKLAKKPQVGVVKDSGVARDVLGDHSRLNGCVQCAYGLRPLKSSAGDFGREGKHSAALKAGRPPKRGSRWDKYSKLAMHASPILPAGENELHILQNCEDGSWRVEERPQAVGKHRESKFVDTLKLIGKC